MIKKLRVLLFVLLSTSISNAEVVKNIEINGNSRISDETIIVYGEINKNFEHNLFLDFEDAFKNRNSQRQFYTIPGSRLPPDQMKFARWLYNDDTSCKLNTADCMPYPRYKRVRIGNQL